MPAVQDLSIRQLQYIVAVADTLGFHRAAQRCHVSQPTLSAQVQQAEDVLGVRIFERDKRRVMVTPAGTQLVARARQVLVAMEDLLASAVGQQDPFATTFRVGVIPTIAPYLLPDITLALRRMYPRLRVVWREETTSQLASHLLAGQLDAGLAALVPELDEMQSAVVLEDPFVVALPLGHPLAKKKTVALGDLEPCPVLLLDDGHCFRSQALALCARAGAHEVDFRATSLATLAQMVSAGAGVTLLPVSSVSVENRRGQLEIRPFAGSAPGRTIGLVWRPASPYAAAFAAVAGTLARALSNSGQSSAKRPSFAASSRHHARTASKAPGVRR
jgi:LysR family hydrogen peroxide-inducible transcriptional activator